jgi:hypothetical protein
MPMRALGPGGSVEDCMVDSAVAVLATIISSRTIGLGTSIHIFRGVYSSTSLPYGSPPHPTLA